MTAMEVTVAASQHPCRFYLQFANPYAYRGAQLVSEYDRLVCTALTARHIGLLEGLLDLVPVEGLMGKPCGLIPIIRGPLKGCRVNKGIRLLLRRSSLTPPLTTPLSSLAGDAEAGSGGAQPAGDSWSGVR